MDTPDTIRKYWFGCAVENAAVIAAERARLWWSKGPESDDEIRQRFPHRNEVLGRMSTAEELRFLQQPDTSF